MVVIDPAASAALPGRRPEDDVKEQMRRILTPHIRDVKSGMMDELATCVLGTQLPSRDRITAGRAFCESGLQELRAHMAVCACDDGGRSDGLVKRIVAGFAALLAKVIPGAAPRSDAIADAVRLGVRDAVKERFELSEKLVRAMEDNLETVVIPRMEYSVERDRAAGLLKFYFRVPSLGARFESYSQPEHALALIEKEQENLAHAVLNERTVPIVAEVQSLLRAHGILEFEQPEPEFDLGDILGEDDGRPPRPSPFAASPLGPPARPSPLPSRPPPAPGDDEDEADEEEEDEEAEPLGEPA